MDSSTHLFYGMLWPIIQALWITGPAVALFFGAWALFKPDSFIIFSIRVNSCIKTPVDQAPRLDRSKYIEWFVYRNNVPVGLTFIGCAMFMIYYGMFKLDHATLQKAFEFTQVGIWPRIFMESSLGYLYLVGVLGLVVGTIVAVRPSVLRKAEIWGNRWINTREISESANESSAAVDRLVAHNPRLFGGVVLVVSTVALTVILQGLLA